MRQTKLKSNHKSWNRFEFYFLVRVPSCEEPWWCSLVSPDKWAGIFGLGELHQWDLSSIWGVHKWLQWQWSVRKSFYEIVENKLKAITFFWAVVMVHLNVDSLWKYFSIDQMSVCYKWFKSFVNGLLDHNLPVDVNVLHFRGRNTEWSYS